MNLRKSKPLIFIIYSLLFKILCRIWEWFKFIYNSYMLFFSFSLLFFYPATFPSLCSYFSHSQSVIMNQQYFLFNNSLNNSSLIEGDYSNSIQKHNNTFFSTFIHEIVAFLQFLTIFLSHTKIFSIVHACKFNIQYVFEYCTPERQ